MDAQNSKRVLFAQLEGIICTVDHDRRDGSSSSSQPFRVALAWSPSSCDYPCECPRYFRSPAHQVGPGSRISFLHFTFFLLLLLFCSSHIQSYSDLKRSSACRFSAGCCRGTVQSNLLYPSLLKKTGAPSGRLPLAFSRSPLEVDRAEPVARPVGQES